MSKKKLLVIAGLCCALPAALIFGPLVMMGMLIGADSGDTAHAARADSRCTLGAASTTARTGELGEDQVHNARTIVAVGKQLDVPPRGWVIALAAALQESGLRNLDYGDRDSLGLFQQRPSAGWGTPDQITTPAYAARAFYGGPTSPTTNRGLLSIHHWQHLPLWQAAQAVQRSAYPMAYAPHQRLATTLVTKLAGVTAGCEPLAAGPWVLPVAGDYQLTSRYGGRTSPTTGAVDFHTGLDFAAPTGTPVHAVADGTIAWAAPSGTGYGNLVRIHHPDGVETYYAHLSEISAVLGTPVKAGDTVGEIGSTGNSTGPHVHLEVRVDDQPRDPYAWLKKKGLNP